jgi:excisionase family DNA binding protein
MRPTLNVADVAARLGTNEQHIRKLARERRIPHYRIGALYKFDPDEIDAWLTTVHVDAAAAAAEAVRA